MHEYLGNSSKGDQQLEMADVSIGVYDTFSLCGCIWCLSVFKVILSMQTILVIITFTLAVAFLVRKFIWTPIFESQKKSLGTLDGGKTKCGKEDCQCH